MRSGGRCAVLGTPSSIVHPDLMTAHELSNALVAAVEDGFPALSRVDEAASARRPAPGTWSAKEVIGHLVDSAANNHGRFIRAQLEDDLVCPGYAQDDWVRVQRYDAVAWRPLLELWRAYNLHLAHVIASTPAAELARPRRRHNLHLVAWQTVPEHEPATLGYFVADYIGHLRHHLAQAVERSGATATRAAAPLALAD